MLNIITQLKNSLIIMQLYVPHVDQMLAMSHSSAMLSGYGACLGRFLILYGTVPVRVTSSNLLGNQTTISLINFTRDYHLNTVCRDICVEETSKCITTCDPTDSKCVNGCLRAELTCVESKQFYINKIPEYYTGTYQLF